MPYLALMRSRLWSLFVAVAWPVLGDEPAAVPLAELAKKAELVVRGKVESKSIQRDAEGRIFTSVNLVVEEVLKGKAKGSNLKVAHSGGILGEKRAQTVGQVEYAIGEELIGFYVFNEKGEALTLNLAQGKISLRAENATEVKARVVEALK